MNFFGALRRGWARPATARAHIDAFAASCELRKLGGGPMKVRVKETGELVHVPANNQIIDLLIKTGAIEPIQEAPAARPARQEWVPPKTPARFWIKKEELSTGDYVIAWFCDTCKTGGRFPGVKIDKVHLLRAWHCGHVGGEHVPSNVAAQYMSLGRPSQPYLYPGQIAKQEPAPVGDYPLTPEAEPISEGPAFAEALVAYEAALKEAEEAARK
jgi:hypothetical protein